MRRVGRPVVVGHSLGGEIARRIKDVPVVSIAPAEPGRKTYILPGTSQGTSEKDYERVSLSTSLHLLSLLLKAEPGKYNRRVIVVYGSRDPYVRGNWRSWFFEGDHYPLKPEEVGRLVTYALRLFDEPVESPE